MSLNGVVACDITLLDRNTDLSLLAIPLLPLPDGLLLVPATASDQPSTSIERPLPREQLPHVASPLRDLSREGPFDAYCAPSDTGDHPLISDGLPGCHYRMTSYASADIAYVDPVYGLQLYHPRFLEFIGAPESARLPTRAPGHWVRTMDQEDAVVAALRLQHDAGLMTSNLQVIGQFVTSLNRMSSEVLRLALGPEVFPSEVVDILSPVPRAPRATHYMSAMGLWQPPGGPSTPGPLPVSSCSNCMNCSKCFPGLPN